MARQSRTAAKKPTEQAREPAIYGQWARDTVSVADAVQQHRNRRYNSADLIARVEGTIETCVRLIAEQCNAVPLRLYATARSDTGKRFGKSLTRRQAKSIRNPAIVGKAAGYAQGADEVVEVEWHPVMDLLANPNPHMSGQEYDLLLWDHELTGGTAYEYVRESGMPEALLPLYPTWVTPQPSFTRLLDGFWYYRGTPAETFYDVEDVNAYRIYPDRANPYVGRSPLRGIIKQADLAAAIVVEALSRIQNDCRVENAWVSELPITPDQQKEAEQRLQRYRGPTNKGKSVVLGGLKPYPMQSTYKDMEWKELADRIDRAIRNAYGVPESFADLNKSNLAGAEEGLGQYHRLTIQPKLRMRAEQRTDMLLPRFGVRPGEMWFAPDEASIDDVEQESRVHVSYVGAGIITINEARAEIGLEPLEWGDRPQLGMGIGAGFGTEPIDVDAVEVEDQAALPAGDGAPPGAAPVQDTALNGAQVTALAALMESVVAGRLPVDAAIAAARMSFPTVPEETINATFEPLRNFKPTPEPDPNANPPAGEGDKQDAKPSEDDAEQVGAESEPAEGAKAIDLKATGFWFRDDHGAGCQCEQHKAIDPSPEMLVILLEWYALWIDTLARSELTQIPILALDARKQLATILRPELERLVTDGYVEILARDGRPIPPTLSDDVKRAVDEYLSRLTVEITDTLTVDVQAAIRRGIEQGLSLDEVTELVAEAMGTEADWRAERVARTETARAVEYGRIEGYAEIGVERKEWIPSAAPCQYCASAVVVLKRQYPNGVPLRDPFFRAGDIIRGVDGGTMIVKSDIMVPADIHPNDACSVVGVRG